MKSFCLMSNKHIKIALPHFFLLTSQLCFSGWAVLGTLVLRNGVNAFVFVLYREIAASIFLYAIIIITRKINKENSIAKKLNLNIDKSDYKRFFFLGLCSFVNVVGAMLALEYIGATTLAIFQTMIPCVATAISITLGIEKYTNIKAFGIIISVIGAVIVEVFKLVSNSESNNNIYVGTAILCIQVIFMASLVVFQKPMLLKYEPCVVSFLYYSIGTVFTIVLCAVWSFQLHPSDFSFNNELLPWLGLLYAVLFGTVYTYSSLSWSVKRLSPSVTTVYNTFQPVGTIGLSYLVLGTIITITDGIGALLVIMGLIITVYGQQDEQREYENEENKERTNKYSNENINFGVNITHVLSESKYVSLEDQNDDDSTEENKILY